MLARAPIRNKENDLKKEKKAAAARALVLAKATTNNKPGPIRILCRSAAAPQYTIGTAKPKDGRTGSSGVARGRLAAPPAAASQREWW
jgi:hypothetical protein